MTAKVMVLLDSLNIECPYVPANMTLFFQPLDLTVNRFAKNIMEKQFTRNAHAHILPRACQPIRKQSD